MFWPNEFSHEDNALSYYKEMKKIGIFYDNPKKLSQRLNTLKDNDKFLNGGFPKKSKICI